MEDYQIRLQRETIDLANKTNALGAILQTRSFYLLSRAKKDLMYDQYHAMLTLLQILGKRCEMEEIPLYEKDAPVEDFDEHITHPDFDAWHNHLSKERSNEDGDAISLDDFLDNLEGDGL